jgi:hypothetical protein
VHAGDAVVVARDEAHDVLADHGVLIGVDAVDARDVQANAREHALPPRHRVRPYNRVRGREFIVLVQRRTPWRRDFVPSGLAGGFEDGLRTCRCEGLEVRAEGGRYSVVALWLGLRLVICYTL